ncbi:DUF5819 family protein [Streptomyces sp. NPDC020801]|uniref:DUF5819 family protein n=1 Tax=Streptomyces sp. NPDC020801 TaxID=3365093 RepID=UPI0037B7584C
MDAHDEDSNAPDGRHGPGGTGGPGLPGLPDRPPADPDDASSAGLASTSTSTTTPASASAAPSAVPAPAPAPAHGPTPGPGAPPCAAGASHPVPDAAPVPEPAFPPDAAPGPRTGSRGGIAALSPPYQVGAALALAVVAVAACVHLGMVFLHVAPPNTVTRQHGKAVDEWVYPEFEQNWKLFAPNPLQQDIAVQVRAEVRTTGGETRTTGWYDLSAQDGRAIDGNVLPSHTQQNELRRAFDFYGATHDSDDRPMGLRGALAEQYLRRIVVLRLDRDHAAGAGGVVERVQVRGRTTDVPPPKWSKEKVSQTPAYHLLPWWVVPAAEARGGVR